jgi:FkbM family methyltransferase
VRRVKINDINFELDISNYMEWVLYFGISVEPRDKLYHLVKNKHYIVDVGANIGETSLHFAKYSPDSIIYAFEPDPVCYEKCKRNLLLNQFKNIHLYNFGLGDENRKYYLSPDTYNNLGGNKIRPESSHVPNIDVKRLDDVLIRENIKCVDFMKIDVEGFEYRVLKGSEQTIKRFRPVLFIEINDNNLRYQGSSAAELISFLEKYYTNIINANTDKPVFSSDNFNNCHYDIIVYS